MACEISNLHRKLITANHILHYHDVVDAYGHISVRHPERPEVYIMCGYMAPAVVPSPADLIEYFVEDSATVNPRAKKGYLERFIHGELFKRFPEINCVVHSHAEAVLPYVTSGVPLLPVFHMAGFLGNSVPVFDIAHSYGQEDQQDMLVNNVRLGSTLAAAFSHEEGSAANSGCSLDHNVVLIQRHGFTTHGIDIETAVYRAIYTKINAGVQTTAMSARYMFPQVFDRKLVFDFEYLTPGQTEGCQKMNEGTQDKPWALWVQEVEKSPLYTNRGNTML